MAAIVAADGHKDCHDINKGTHLRATKGSCNDQATTTAIFGVELESDSSAPVLDKEMQLELEGISSEAQRNIQVAAYVDYTQNHLSMEEINKKYDHHGYFGCCKERFDSNCGGGITFCYTVCKWRDPNLHILKNNECCAPQNRGTKYWFWEECT